MAKKDRKSSLIETRLIGFAASLFFSVPTAVFIWLGTNKELSYWGGFLNSSYLLACIGVFAGIALIFPTVFPTMLGGIWRGILKIERWWGW